MQIGISLAQGYLFARPAAPPPHPDIEEVLGGKNGDPDA
jgi:EAL domain-containing protein (putative c-di-GMP-specific phosphodiesterase class I)